MKGRVEREKDGFKNERRGTNSTTPYLQHLMQSQYNCEPNETKVYVAMIE